MEEFEVAAGVLCFFKEAKRYAIAYVCQAACNRFNGLRGFSRKSPRTQGQVPVVAILATPAYNV
jgi:hypothetical protein